MTQWIHFILGMLACVEATHFLWPNGTYGLPMPRSDCPESPTNSFKSGTRIQETESGSTSSRICHLFDCPRNVRTVKSLFCMKTKQDFSTGAEFAKWGRGRYCIYKKGNCPTGFRYGSLRWDDASSSLMPRGDQDHIGELPDGTYNKNTIIHFCCRNDGSSKDLLKLPTDKPFYLLKMGPVCQKVKDTNVTEEWVIFVTEKSANINGKEGLHPTIAVSARSLNSLKLFYCYYEHSAEDKARGVVVLFIILATMIGGGVTLIAMIFITCRCIQMYKDRELGGEHVQPEDTSMMPTAPPMSERDKQHRIQTYLAPPTYEEATRH